MKLAQFLQTWRGTRLENLVQRWTILTLIVSNIVLGLVALGRGATVSVSVPPGLGDAVTVSRHESDLDYQRAWGLFLATLLGNVTPGNADIVKKSIEPLLAPAIYRHAVRVLSEQVEAVKRDRVAMRFEARQVKFEVSSGKVFVEGFSVVSGAAGKEERNPRTYEFLIKVENYRPVIEHIDNYIGAARTSGELERLDRLEENKQRIDARRRERAAEVSTAGPSEEEP